MSGILRVHGATLHYEAVQVRTEKLGDAAESGIECGHRARDHDEAQN